MFGFHKIINKQNKLIFSRARIYCHTRIGLVIILIVVADNKDDNIHKIKDQQTWRTNYGPELCQI